MDTESLEVSILELVNNVSCHGWKYCSSLLLILLWYSNILQVRDKLELPVLISYEFSDLNSVAFVENTFTADITDSEEAAVGELLTSIETTLTSENLETDEAIEKRNKMLDK